MRFQNLVFILIISITLTGCFSSETDTNSNANKSEITNSDASNRNRINSTNESAQKAPLGTETTPTPQKLNEAETLTPIVSAFCNAINSKNDAALQKVYSKEAWRTMQNYARQEGFSSVAAFMNDGEPVGNKCSVINEQISGSTAVARVTTETYPKGVELKFVKEGSEWKMTTQSTEF